MTITASLKPLRQRMTELQDSITALCAELQAQAGIPVLLIAPCGHPECGDPPPHHLPDDALVVHMGCAHQCPEQLDQAALDAEAATPAEEPSPAQQQSFEQLLALAKAPTPQARLLTR